MQKMKSCNFKCDANIFDSILRSILKHRKLDYLDRVLDMMEIDNITVGSYPIARIIDYLLEKGDALGILEVIEKLERRVGVSYDDSVADYAPLFNKLCKLSSVGMRLCEKIKAQMQNHGLKANAAINNALLDGYLSIDGIDKAIEIYKLMQAEQTKPKQRSINALKEWCGAHKRIDLLAKLGFV
jgi:hypothetical protein